MLTAWAGGVYFASDMNVIHPFRPLAAIVIIRPKGALPI